MRYLKSGMEVRATSESFAVGGECNRGEGGGGVYLDGVFGEEWLCFGKPFPCNCELKKNHGQLLTRILHHTSSTSSCLVEKDRQTVVGWRVGTPCARRTNAAIS